MKDCCLCDDPNCPNAGIDGCWGFWGDGCRQDFEASPVVISVTDEEDQTDDGDTPF